MSTRLPWKEVCGTDAGYQRHRYWKSVPCEACTEAHRLAARERRARKTAPVRELVPCGSASAYRRHLRRGELACAACLEAHAAKERVRWTAAKRAAA